MLAAFKMKKSQVPTDPQVRKKKLQVYIQPCLKGKKSQVPTDPRGRK